VIVPESGAGLLDTSTLILLQRIEDPTLLPAIPLISAVTLAELSVGPLVATDERERASRLALLQQVEADFEPLPFGAAAARCFGRVSASLRRRRSCLSAPAICQFWRRESVFPCERGAADRATPPGNEEA